LHRRLYRSGRLNRGRRRLRRLLRGGNRKRLQGFRRNYRHRKGMIAPLLLGDFLRGQRNHGPGIREFQLFFNRQLWGKTCFWLVERQKGIAFFGSNITLRLDSLWVLKGFLVRGRCNFFGREVQGKACFGRISNFGFFSQRQEFTVKRFLERDSACTGEKNWKKKRCQQKQPKTSQLEKMFHTNSIIGRLP
jgi:hypothetical protein